MLLKEGFRNKAGLKSYSYSNSYSNTLISKVSILYSICVTFIVGNPLTRESIVNTPSVFCALNKECGQLNPWQPSDMLHRSPRTADKFAEEYDRHGDSYTQDATVESLKEVFNNVQSQVEWVYVTRVIHSRQAPLDANGPFAANCHIVQKTPCWRASYPLGRPKQRKFKFDWMNFLCFGYPSA